MALPTASNNTVAIAEDTTKVFSVADFGYSDADNDPMEAVSITTLPFAGQLTLNGAPVPLGWFITVAELNAGKLVFTPAGNASGGAYAVFSFKVSDSTSVSAASYTMTIDVSAVNDAPTASNRTVSTNEDTARAFTVADFGFADVDSGSSLQSITITSLPTAGSLKHLGAAVSLNETISAQSIASGQLIFTPAANANGSGYASFGFRVGDGASSSADAYTMTIDVASVQDNLVLTGTSGNDVLTGDTLDPDSNDTLSGLAGDDNLNGVGGNDSLSGGDGADTLDGAAGDDTLDGGAGEDSLRAGAGNDQLDGGAGNDTLSGDDGNDTYHARDASDVVSEPSATGGTDIVWSYIPSFVLPTNVENGRIASVEAANLTGNGGKNTLYAGKGNNVIDGGAGIDTLSYEYALVGTAGVTVSLAKTTAQATGGSGSDTVLRIENLIGSNYADKLTGNAGANRLFGWSSNDTLDGGAGVDTMDGGNGYDTYYVRNIGDRVIETNPVGGIDTVFSYLASYVLPGNVENGRAMIGGGAQLIGNVLPNTLSGAKGSQALDGGSGNDTLNGGAGNDTLTGGRGLDTFRFDTALDPASNVDSLTDFNVADDTISLENAVFTSLVSTGPLAEGMLRAGAGVTSAADADDFLLYDSTTGALYYDADGNGAAVAMRFATLVSGLSLTAVDFLVS